ncbi:MAG: tetratricopeptide repeat protein [Pseudomonadota bacterium]
MSQNDDDRFVREVNEELRRERMQSAWKNFGPLVIGVAVLIVVVVAGNQFYKYWTESAAARNGDAFAAATAQLEAGNGEQGLAALNDIAADGTAEYRALAQLRLGNASAKDGELEAALALFNEVAGSGGVPDFLRDFATLRAGQIMVDTASFEEVSAKLTPIAGDGSAYRFSASESIALAAYKAENYGQARERFEALVSTQGTPRALAQRANIMLELMTSQGLIEQPGANVDADGIRSGGAAAE